MLGKFNLVKATWSATGLAAKIAVFAVATTIGVANVVGSAGASLNALSTSGPQSITSGTLSLPAPVFPLGTGLGTTGAGFTTAVSALAPADVIHRFATYQNAGTVATGIPSMWFVDSTPTILTTDSSLGLKVTITRCTVAWTYASATATPVCGGTQSVWLAQTALNAVGKTEATKTAFTNVASLAAGENAYLKFDLTYPDRVERRTNGAVATANDGTALTSGSIQGLVASITWNVYAEQRAVISDSNA